MKENQRSSILPRQENPCHAWDFEQNSFYPDGCPSVSCPSHMPTSNPLIQVPPLLDSVRPILRSCHDTSAALASLVPSNQFWRWKEMWSNSLRTAVYSAALVEYLSTGSLITISQANELLGSELAEPSSNQSTHIISVKEEWADRFLIAVEDYLHGLISLVNELVNESGRFFSPS